MFKYKRNKRDYFEKIFKSETKAKEEIIREYNEEDKCELNMYKCTPRKHDKSIEYDEKEIQEERRKTI